MYSLGIYIYVLLIKVTALFNSKAKLWVDGRKNIFEILKKTIPKNIDIVWFHVASLGEFEQGRPVIEKFKVENPEYKILLTFFSPSGYEVRKNYKNADYVFYLPYDSKKNAERFIDIVNPKIVFFVKYEFWFHYLKTLHSLKIPTYIFSSIFRDNQVFFKWYGGFYRRILKFFTHIFVQNENSRFLLKNINVNNVSVAGDTRFDTVFQNSKSTIQLDKIIKFKEDATLIIGGSTWEKDEDLLIKYINESNSKTKFIIAPHEVKKSNIERIKNSISTKSLLYSEISDVNINEYKVLIVDCIGILSSLYKYSDIAYIGNGFGKSGIHNTLEPAVFGNAIVFGPNYHKFKEAIDLIEMKSAFVISNFEELKAIFDELQKNTTLYLTAKNNSKQYIDENAGSTQKILSLINM